MFEIAIFYCFGKSHYHIRYFNYCKINGCTHWDNAAGRGSRTGEPHYGNHAWPTLNGTMWVMMEDEKVDKFLELLHKLDELAEKQGLRAFVLKAEKAI